MEKNLVNYNLDIPFKEFMAGQIIDPVQFNDDMAEIEEKVNEIVEKHNSLNNSAREHIVNKDNPHETTAHQVGTYTGEEIDGFVDDIKDGGLNPKSIKNEVLADNCVDSRTIANHTITASKVDSLFGGQIDISKNTDITDRYTKTEVDSLIKEKVGEGAYSKEEIDKKFQEVQAGQIVDKTIGVDKLKDDVGTLLDISANKSITDRYTKEEVDVLVRENGLPRDWGGLEEIVEKQHYGHLPVANVMTADEFIAPSTPVLDIDVREVVGARNGHDNLGERLNSIDSQLEHKASKYNTLNDLINDSKLKVNDICETLGHTNINDGGGALYKIVNSEDGYCEPTSNGLYAKLIHNNVFKPEQFGCVGQTDCSEKLNNMIKYIETLTPIYDFNNESSSNCYDWSNIKLEFNREYLISSSIVFNNTIFLNIDNLKLKAINSFVRDTPLLKLNGNNRNFNITNSNFDCNYICDIGVMLTDYTIGSSISNCYIYGFLTKGYYAVNTGYEVKFNNVKIEQCTWENVSKLNELTDGIGIHLGARQQDYKFNNVIINYCKNNGMYLESGANFLNNVHLWGCNFKSLGRYNFFTNCYFDTTLETNGYFSFNNCYFAFSKNEPIIKSLENSNDGWNFAYGKITNCTFTSSVNITSFFENVSTNYYPLMLNNSFQNVKIVVNKSVGEVFGDGYYPIKQTRYNGTSDVNIINFGELVFMYGSGTGSKTFNFPVALETVLGYSATNKSGGNTINANATNSYLYVGSDSEYTWHIIGTIKI